MDPKEYVELSLNVMPEVVVGLKDTMEKWAQKVKEEGKSVDPFTYIGAISSAMESEMKKYADQITSHGITMQEFNDYKDTHKKELDQYLEENPEEKEKIDQVKQDLDNIMKNAGFEKA